MAKMRRRRSAATSSALIAIAIESDIHSSHDICQRAVRDQPPGEGPSLTSTSTTGRILFWLKRRSLQLLLAASRYAELRRFVAKSTAFFLRENGTRVGTTIRPPWP